MPFQFAYKNWLSLGPKIGFPSLITQQVSDHIREVTIADSHLLSSSEGEPTSSGGASTQETDQSQRSPMSSFDLNDDVSGVHFDPDKHLANGLNPETPTGTMAQLGLPDSALSSTAFTGPFPLLTPEAVNIHRREILQPEVLKNLMSQTWPSSVQIRGVAPDYGKFIHEFWNSDQLKKVVSEAAGAELEPVMDYEIAHANIQIKPSGPSPFDQLMAFPREITASEVVIDSNQHDAPKLPEEKDMVVEWHKDCYPFVVIVMLSDPQGMSGGETVVRMGDGSHKFVKSPGVGQALVFQGGQILHAALPTINSSERITLVTSFRPKLSVPKGLFYDMSHLGNVRRYSNLTVLYEQWQDYRFDVMIAHMAHMDKKMLEDQLARKRFDVDEYMVWRAALDQYYQKTIEEMVPEEQVKKG